MRSLTTGLIVIASLSLASCAKLGFPVVTGGLKLTLDPATITRCQSVVLDDPYTKNTNLRGRSSIEVRNGAMSGAVGRYPNPAAETVVLKGAGDYRLSYVIQNPQFPEKLNLTFRCTTSGAESTQVFTITETSLEQPVNLSF